MIKIERAKQPYILERKGKEWTEKLLSTSSEKEKRKTDTKYKHLQVKETLVAMFHGKCAYCESKITHIDYGHIEHYRPKSLFPSLTFDWSNLLLACGICNGAKGDRFPEISDGGPIINPCDDDVDNHFEFFYDDIARLTSVIGRTTRGQITEQLLGLNRHDLRKYRSNQVRKIYALVRLARTDSEAKDLLTEAIKDSAEYAAFARAICLAKGSVPCSNSGA